MQSAWDQKVHSWFWAPNVPLLHVTVGAFVKMLSIPAESRNPQTTGRGGGRGGRPSLGKSADGQATETQKLSGVVVDYAHECWPAPSFMKQITGGGARR